MFRTQSPSLAFWVAVALKIVLIGLLAFGAFSGLQQFEGKAFLWRLITYPVGAFAVPICWLAFARRSPFPFVADILLTLPFLVDTGGNSLDLYDTVEWWDDANHFVNWALLSGAVAALMVRVKARSRETIGLVVGLGAVTAILWEIAEYYAFIRASPELATAYTDTLGNLGLGLAGSIFVGLVAAVLSKQRRSRSSNSPDQ